MSRLSISRAWDEAKGRLASDGKLYTTVALAMIALPSAVSTLVNPNSGMSESTGSPGSALITLVMSLIALVGQLAIIRLALGPSVSVGGAIRHAASRALPYIGSILLLLVALFVLAIPFGAVLAAMGASFEETAELPPGAWIPILLFVAALLYLAARMLMSSSVASAESAGPIKILTRSWQLTRGHAARLLAFLLLFLVALIVVLAAVAVVVGLMTRALFGDVEPLSIGALVIGLVQGLLSAAATTIFAVMLARIYVQLSGAAAPEAEVTVPHSGT